MDPFAAALDAQFNAPGSAAAVYIPADGYSADIRIIRSQPDVDVPYGSRRVVQASNAFEIRKSEVESPAAGDRLMIGDTVYEILGDAMLDVEGLTWSCGADVVPL
ncbi:hypothetical protein [uncultured Sphingomonas sp.]|uniref:head-tail joining protein n=1 Tax=uncultured Sphingomonas sp. TaxID=158754 RepID=UPI0025D66ABA|nr:hypothetical protein [uncultured Sphingomonas sp.]